MSFLDIIFSNKKRTYKKKVKKTKTINKKTNISKNDKYTKKKYKIYEVNDKLDNGLEYKLYNYPKANGATIALGIRAGSINETDDTAGLAHFLEHMMFRGTVKYGTQDILTSKIEKLGGKLNAYTYKNMTVYFFTTYGKTIHRALEIFADMICNSRFICSDIDSEKKIIKRELMDDYNKPDRYAIYALNNLHYKNTPYADKIIGEVNTINSITREHLLAFMVSNYIAKNMALVVYGNIGENMGKIIKSIKHNFSMNDMVSSYKQTKLDTNYNKYMELLNNFQQHNNYVNSRKMIQDLYPKRTLRFKSEVKENLTQTYIRIAFSGVRLDTRVESVLDYIKYYLSRGMSSKLFTNIRTKKSLTYSTSINQINYPHCGMIVIKINTEPNVSYVKDAIERILNELNELKKSLLSDKIINSVKRKISFVVYNNKNDTDDIAISKTREILYPYNYKFSNKPITGIDIREVARKIFVEDKMTVYLLSSEKYTKNQVL